MQAGGSLLLLALWKAGTRQTVGAAGSAECDGKKSLISFPDKMNPRGEGALPTEEKDGVVSG